MTYAPLARILLRATAALLLLFAVTYADAQAAQQSKPLSGHWIGSLDTVHPDGSVDPGDLYLNLDPAHPTANAAGASADHLSPASQATITASTAHLTIPIRGTVIVRLDLTLQNGHLRGTATGLPADAGDHLVVDAVPADTAWHPSAPVVHATDTLAATVAALDAKLFHAYNTCDLTTLGNLVSEDLEFYHDKTGLAVGRKPFVDAIQNNICGKTERELTPGSLEVHRLNHYGALELGTHRFVHPGHPEIPEGDAKFAMLWQFSNNTWHLTRVISYDHAATK